MVRPRANPQNRTTTTRQGQPLKQSRDPESKQPSLEKSEKGPKLELLIPDRLRVSADELEAVDALEAVAVLEPLAP